MITDEDLEHLPLNVDAAFVALVDLLNDRLNAAKPERYASVARQYVQVMLAFIDEHNMEIAISRGTAASAGSDQWFDWFDEFHGTVNYYQARIKFRHRVSPIDAQLAAVPLNDDYRHEIHQLLNKIRKVVANLDITDQKRDAIYARIADLAAEVDKSKTGFGALTALFLEACEAGGKGAEKLEPLVRLIERVGNVFARARGQQALPPPVKSTTKRLPSPTPPARPSQDLDDEIPF